MFWKAVTFFFFFFLISPCWNQPCAVSNWWFLKHSAGVAHSHDNKSEVFTFVFPRDVWARPLLPLNHLIRRAVPAALIPHQPLVTANFRMRTSVLFFSREINIIAASRSGHPHLQLVFISLRGSDCDYYRKFNSEDPRDGSQWMTEEIFEPVNNNGVYSL